MMFDAPASMIRSPFAAAGLPQIRTLRCEDGLTLPPMWGDTPLTSGQRCRSASHLKAGLDIVVKSISVQRAFRSYI